MEEKLLIVEYFLDCGRMGELDGLFICTEGEMNRAIGKTVYWGEVLGKHSEIDHVLAEADLVIKSDDQEFIKKLQQVLNVTSDISGFNPVNRALDRDYNHEDEDEE